VHQPVQARQAPRCNIGPAEIHRRQVTATVISAASVLLAIAISGAGLAHIARFAVWPFATAAAITWLQVVNRFCVRFGIGGLQNLGALGEERPVEQRFLAADQRRSWQMIGEGILIGLVIALAFVNLPV
jgi:hypothetical protein